MRNFKNKPILFRGFVRFINIFYHKRTYTGVENLKSPSIIITNHSQIHAPLTHTLFFPTDAHFWCIADMLHYKTFSRHAYQGFWSGKPKSVRWIFKIASYVLLPLAWFFRRANLIPVYHDHRIKKTIEVTLDLLNKGHDILICPEKWDGFDGITNEFHDKFVDVAKLYYRKTGVALDILPMYTCPALKTNVIGKPIKFNPDAPIVEERARVVEYIRTSIKDLAISLPRHRVVPFNNVGKDVQPMSKPE